MEANNLQVYNCSLRSSQPIHHFTLDFISQQALVKMVVSPCCRSVKLARLVPTATLKTAARFINSSSLEASLLPPSQRLASNPSKMPPKEQLQFGRVFSDHMLTIEYATDKGGWQVPKIGKFEDLKLSPAASSLHYGT